MLTDLLKPEILELIEQRNWTELRDALVEWPAPEVADLLLHLRKEDRVLLYRALPRRMATDVFAYLDLSQQDELLRDLTDEETRALLEGIAPDDRTHLLEELPGRATQRLLNLLSPEDLKEARWLLGYPEESVGRLMTPDYVAVHPHWTIEDALQHVRTHGQDSETITRIFVTDELWHLIGEMQLRQLILAPPEALVSDVMKHPVMSVQAFADREAAVGIIRKYDRPVLPVVDSENVMVGIVTIDDVLVVADQEATEDFHRSASVGHIGESLSTAPLRTLYRARVGWLMVLVFMNILSGAGIAYFEDTLAAALALAFFLPLLIASGGNAGSQSATLMIRAMALGDVRASDWFKLLGRELAVALALGLSMAIGVAFVAAFRAPEVLVVVTMTMTIVVLVGSLIGMSLPFIFHRFGWDPAAASGPLVTSLADISGVLIYFSIATWYLSR